MLKYFGFAAASETCVPVSWHAEVQVQQLHGTYRGPVVTPSSVPAGLHAFVPEDSDEARSVCDYPTNTEMDVRLPMKLLK